MAQALPPITMKGISREVVPYAVDGMLRKSGEAIRVFSEHITGLDFYLNASMIDATNATHVRKVLQDAIEALEVDPAAKGAAADAAAPAGATVVGSSRRADARRAKNPCWSFVLPSC